MDATLLKDYHTTRQLPEKGLWAKLFGKKDPVCFAPFSSLTFGHNGQILACCYNRFYVLGVFPNETLEQVWRGERANALRRYIEQNDLSHGCQICELHLNSRSFDAVPARHYDGLGLPPQNAPFPLRLDFELSNSCNLECIQCSGISSSAIRKNREKLPPLHSPYNDEFLRQLDPFLPHVRESTFVGGEPFLIPIYFQIWERLMDVNPNANLHVQTNGSILNPRVKKILEKMRFNIGLSLDSLNEENYRAIRVNGDLTETMENARYFIDYARRRGTSFTVSFCVMPQNRDELPDFVRWSNDNGVPVHFNIVTIPNHCSLRYLPPAELKALIIKLKAANLPAETELQRHNLQRYQDVVKMLEQWGAQTSAYSLAQIQAIDQSCAHLPDTSREIILTKLKLFVSLGGLSQETQDENYKILSQKVDELYRRFAADGQTEAQITPAINRFSVELLADTLLNTPIEDLYLLGKAHLG